MKKLIIVMLTIFTAVLVVGCSGTGTADKAETKKETTKESKQANAVKKK